MLQCLLKKSLESIVKEANVVLKILNNNKEAEANRGATQSRVKNNNTYKSSVRVSSVVQSVNITKGHNITTSIRLKTLPDSRYHILLTYLIYFIFNYN